MSKKFSIYKYISCNPSQFLSIFIYLYIFFLFMHFFRRQLYLHIFQYYSTSLSRVNNKSKHTFFYSIICIHSLFREALIRKHHESQYRYWESKRDSSRKHPSALESLKHKTNGNVRSSIRINGIFYLNATWKTLIENMEVMCVSRINLSRLIIMNNLSTVIGKETA